jgi:hypothetical protein
MTISSVFDFMTQSQIADTQSANPTLDLTTPIQTALNSGASTVVFPPGNYRFSQVTVPTAVHAIEGAGIGQSKLFCIGSISQYQPWIYFGNIAAINVFGFTLTQDKTTYGLNSALNFGSCSSGSVHDLLFIQAGFAAVYMAGCQSFEISNVTANAFNNSAIISEANSNRIRINNCSTMSAGSGHSIAVSGGQGHEVSDNYVNTAGVFGIAISGSDSIVARNRIWTNTIEGINLQDGSRVNIQDNIVYCQAGHHDFGISIYAANAPAQGCVVSGNRVFTSGSAGIGIASTNFANAYCRYNMITGNLIMSPIQNPSNVPTDARAGITLYGGQNAANTVQANTILDEAANMLYGVAEWNDSTGDPTYNMFIHNAIPTAPALVAQTRTLGSTTRVWNL